MSKHYRLEVDFKAESDEDAFALADTIESRFANTTHPVTVASVKRSEPYFSTIKRPERDGDRPKVVGES